MQLLSGGNQVKYIMSFYRHLIVLKSKLTNSKSLIPITFLSYEVLLSNFHVKEIKNRIGICDTVAVIREAPKLSEFEKKKVSALLRIITVCFVDREKATNSRSLSQLKSERGDIVQSS